MATRGALEAMLSVTGQEEFAASMRMAMGSVKELAGTVDAVSTQLMAAGAKMDAAFGAQRLKALKATNAELGVTRGHLKNIVGLLGGPGVVTGFGLYEAIKIASRQATNVMQWQSEAGVPASSVPGLQRLAGRQAGLGISNVDAGQIIRQIESAYSGRASTSQLQSIITQSSNLQAISGGRVTALDAASLLVPLLQSNSKFFNGQTGANQAAQIVNAMVGTGNMQTQDALSILQTGAPAALAGLGIPLKDLAPFYAFGADTRGGQQAAPFARLLQNSIMRAMRPSKAGQKALARLLPGVDVANLLKTPGGLETFLNRLHNAEANDPTATQDTADIFGGTRGAATPLSIYGNYGLFQTKMSQFTELNNPNYFADAVRLGQGSPAQRWNVAKAGVSNALGDLGTAMLPALTSMLPHLADIFRELAGPAKVGLTLLSTAFSWLANPITLRVIEGLVVLKGASMIANGVGMLAGRVGTMQGGLIANGVGGMLPASPMGRYRSGLAQAMGMDSASVSETVGGMGKVERAAGSLRTALVGGGGARMAMGAGLGAGIGYASTSSGGSLLAGGLEGALSGALLGMSAGPWGAAAGVIGGVAGAVVGHFNAMSRAAAANAAAVNSSVSSIVASGQSNASVISGDVSGNMDLQLGLNKIGVTSKDLTAASTNPVLLAKYRAMAAHLPHAQRQQVYNMIDILTGRPGAERARNTALGQGNKNAAFIGPNDQNVLTWAQTQGIFPIPNPNIPMQSLLPRTSDITNSLRQKYATAHGLNFNASTGFAPPTGDTYNIYPSAKMDELQLAKMVAEETKKARARS